MGSWAFAYIFQTGVNELITKPAAPRAPLESGSEGSST